MRSRRRWRFTSGGPGEVLCHATRALRCGWDGACRKASRSPDPRAVCGNQPTSSNQNCGAQARDRSRRRDCSEVARSDSTRRLPGPNPRSQSCILSRQNRLCSLLWKCERPSFPYVRLLWGSECSLSGVAVSLSSKPSTFSYRLWPLQSGLECQADGFPCSQSCCCMTSIGRRRSLLHDRI